jgi:hypothetical protein
MMVFVATRGIRSSREAQHHLLLVVFKMHAYRMLDFHEFEMPSSWGGCGLMECSWVGFRADNYLWRVGRGSIWLMDEVVVIKGDVDQFE